MVLRLNPNPLQLGHPAHLGAGCNGLGSDRRSLLLVCLSLQLPDLGSLDLKLLLVDLGHICVGRLVQLGLEYVDLLGLDGDLVPQLAIPLRSCVL